MMTYWQWHEIARTGAEVAVVHVVVKLMIGAQFIAGLSPVGMRDVVAAVWHGLIQTATMAVIVNMDLGR